jgi:hypothetical protein
LRNFRILSARATHVRKIDSTLSIIIRRFCKLVLNYCKIFFPKDENPKVTPNPTVIKKRFSSVTTITIVISYPIKCSKLFQLIKNNYSYVQLSVKKLTLHEALFHFQSKGELLKNGRTIHFTSFYTRRKSYLIRFIISP